MQQYEEGTTMSRDLMKEAPAAHILNRREMLTFMGGTAYASFLGCAGEPSGTYTPTTIAGCLVSPAQTEGPYFVDMKLNRSDIRLDPADGSVRPGAPLRLVLNVYSVINNDCNPLPGATVDVWHCDALGAYSGVEDNPGEFGDTRGKKFLRGYQVTDDKGKVEFQTIYPGWYTGRTVHIHFMIRTDPNSETGYEFTSQLYFDEAITDQVHAQEPYVQKGRRDTTNNSDGIFRRGGNQLMLQLTKEAHEYVGTYKVGFLMT
jgi:protocatechuate 3,4-dioxygenase beta subunit